MTTIPSSLLEDLRGLTAEDRATVNETTLKQHNLYTRGRLYHEICK